MLLLQSDVWLVATKVLDIGNDSVIYNFIIRRINKTAAIDELQPKAQANALSLRDINGSYL